MSIFSYFNVISWRLLQSLTKAHVFTSYKPIRMHMFVQLFSTDIFIAARICNEDEMTGKGRESDELLLSNLIETNFLLLNARSTYTHSKTCNRWEKKDRLEWNGAQTKNKHESKHNKTISERGRMSSFAKNTNRLQKCEKTKSSLAVCVCVLFSIILLVHFSVCICIP